MASPALAQRQRRGGGGGRGMSSAMLLGQKSVQEELKLSEDQVKKLQEFQTSQREKFQGLRDLSEDERRQKFQELAKESEKVVDETLKPEQKKRLKQISLQLQLRQGTRAYSSPEVASALQLTDEQKDKLKTIGEESQKAGRELFQPGGDRDEARKKFEELRKQTQEKVMGVLTDEQKSKLKELQGEPFKGRLDFGGFGGGRGRGNRNQNNN